MAVKIGDFSRRDGNEIFVYCKSCPHKADVLVARLRARYADNVTLDQIKFRCIKCQGTAARWIIPWQAYYDDPRPRAQVALDQPSRPPEDPGPK